MEAATLKLKHGSALGSGAAGNYIQLDHRKDAIEYAMAGVRLVVEHNSKAMEGDGLFAMFETTMGDSVIETMQQAAYLREYHLWEKDCRAYFGDMFERNGIGKLPKPPKKTGFPEHIFAVAGKFGVVFDDATLGTIKTMRSKANIMKHEDGLTIDHFVTAEEYNQSIGALARFWEVLMEAEEIDYGLACPR